MSDYIEILMERISSFDVYIYNPLLLLLYINLQSSFVMNNALYINLYLGDNTYFWPVRFLERIRDDAVTLKNIDYAIGSKEKKSSVIIVFLLSKGGRRKIYCSKRSWNPYNYHGSNGW